MMEPMRCWLLHLCLIVHAATACHGPRLVSVEVEPVVVSDLVLEIDDDDLQVRTVIEADLARYDDLPGRGRGHLDNVRVRVVGKAPGAVVEARARHAVIDEEGLLSLEGATVEGGAEARSYSITAEMMQIEPNGVLRGEGIHARLWTQ